MKSSEDPKCRPETPVEVQEHKGRSEEHLSCSDNVSSQSFDSEITDLSDQKTDSSQDSDYLQSYERGGQLNAFSKQFVQLLKRAPNRTVNLSEASRQLKIREVTLKDIVKILVPTGSVRRVVKNTYQWVDPKTRGYTKEQEQKYDKEIQQMKLVLKNLKQQESKLDNLMNQIKKLTNMEENHVTLCPQTEKTFCLNDKIQEAVICSENELKIQNRFEKQIHLEILLKNSYGDNLKVEVVDGDGLEFVKQSVTKRRMNIKLKGGEQRVFRWKQEYLKSI